MYQLIFLLIYVLSKEEMLENYKGENSMCLWRKFKALITVLKKEI